MNKKSKEELMMELEAVEKELVNLATELERIRVKSSRARHRFYKLLDKIEKISEEA